MLKIKRKKNAIYNIEMLYKTRNEAITFYDGYSLMMSEGKSKAKKKKRETKGIRLKILAPK